MLFCMLGWIGASFQSASRSPDKVLRRLSFIASLMYYTYIDILQFLNTKKKQLSCFFFLFLFSAMYCVVVRMCMCLAVRLGKLNGNRVRLVLKRARSNRLSGLERLCILDEGESLQCSVVGAVLVHIFRQVHVQNRAKGAEALVHLVRRNVARQIASDDSVNAIRVRRERHLLHVQHALWLDDFEWLFDWLRNWLSDRSRRSSRHLIVHVGRLHFIRKANRALLWSHHSLHNRRLEARVKRSALHFRFVQHDGLIRDISPRQAVVQQLLDNAVLSAHAGENGNHLLGEHCLDCFAWWYFDSTSFPCPFHDQK